MKLKIKATEIYDHTIHSRKRIFINEGSSRSSKTYSTCQALFVMMHERQYQNDVFTVVRKTLPSLKATAYKDFLDIVKSNGTYKKRNHNKSDLTYQIGTNVIEFISVDDYNKIKGRKRRFLFINEANELSYDDFVQLALRTTGRIFMDYNPSHDEYHWIETKVKLRSDVEVLRSTYLDNPFNNEETIREIEMLKDTDPNLWRIYGLGLMGIASARIFTHFQYCDEMPENYITKMYGIDFGFNHPTAVMEIRETDDAIYVDELVYKSGWVNSQLIFALKGWEKMTEDDRNKAMTVYGNTESDFPDLGIDGNSEIFCDSAEPARIEDIRLAGFNAKASNKDVKDGIDTVKSKKIYMTKRSVNAWKEQRGYSWKTTSDGKILDEPVRVFDDAMCAIRYPIHTHEQNKGKAPKIRTLG